MDVQLRMKAKAPDGVILWSGQERMTHSSDFVAIGLRKGHVHFAYNLGSGEVLITYNRSRLDDNQWHKIRVQRCVLVCSLPIRKWELNLFLFSD